MSGSAMTRQLTGRHVLLLFVSFFAVIMAVNGVFLYEALKTLPGEEAGATYENGLRYNATLSEEREQDALHWRHKDELSADGTRLRATFTGSDDGPIRGLVLKGNIARPASNRFDRALNFAELQPGVYEARVEPLDPGSWVASIEAGQGGPSGYRTVYRIKERLWLSPKQ